MRKTSCYRFAVKAVYLLPVIFLFKLSGFSQTSNISGVINSYYQVVEVIPSKAAVRVSSVSGIVPNAHTMIIQMKGASISTTNNSSFGDTVSLNNAGNYEINVICTVIDDTVFMVYDFLNSYTVSGKVQLVQFGEYTSANVIDTIKATPWDNATGTGGVIAMFVTDTLTLNAPVYANTSGYKGGAFIQSNSTCLNTHSSYTYNGSSTSPQLGAMKGEGVADVITSQSGGRGAPANGGGGGNNHNNSGGGGANLNAGGLGGGNSSASGCTATYRGEAGKAMSSWNGQKIFLGGGGGAGHNNNGIFTLGGANGGGIIFIHADTIIGNGYKISADGGTGGNSLSDGAGGGGAGGTIIMDANIYLGSLTIQANGGNGGGSDDGNNIGKCYGGGGGGSGGVVYFSGSIPAITVFDTAGNGGAETRRQDVSCAAIQSPLPGAAGQVIPGYAYRSSSALAGYCSLILPVGLISFKASLRGNKVEIYWKIANPETADKFIIERMNPGQGWTVIKNIYATELREDYYTTDDGPLPGYNLYRLKIIEKNNAETFSPISRVFIQQDKNSFSLYPNPANNKILIAGNFAPATDMQLTDISGKVLLTKKLLNSQTEIILPSLSQGVYLVRIGQTVKKLLIQ